MKELFRVIKQTWLSNFSIHCAAMLLLELIWNSLYGSIWQFLFLFAQSAFRVYIKLRALWVLWVLCHVSYQLSNQADKSNLDNLSKDCFARSNKKHFHVHLKTAYNRSIQGLHQNVENSETFCKFWSNVYENFFKRSTKSYKIQNV